MWGHLPWLQPLVSQMFLWGRSGASCQSSWEGRPIREHNNRVTWLEYIKTGFHHPLSCVTHRNMSHPGYFDDGALCDLLVDAEARSTLEEGDGFPQVPLRHLHQCSYTLDGHKQSSHLECAKRAADSKPKKHSSTSNDLNLDVLLSWQTIRSQRA